MSSISPVRMLLLEPEDYFTTKSGIQNDFFSVHFSLPKVPKEPIWLQNW